MLIRKHWDHVAILLIANISTENYLKGHLGRNKPNGLSLAIGIKQ